MLSAEVEFWVKEWTRSMAPLVVALAGSGANALRAPTLKAVATTTASSCLALAATWASAAGDRFPFWGRARSTRVD
jgi:hypothetical protein